MQIKNIQNRNVMKPINPISNSPLGRPNKGTISRGASESQSSNRNDPANPVDVFERSSRNIRSSVNILANTDNGIFNSATARKGLELILGTATKYSADDIEAMGQWAAEARKRVMDGDVDEGTQRYLGIHPEQIAAHQAKAQESMVFHELPPPFTLARSLFLAMQDNISRDADLGAVINKVNELGTELENALDALRNSPNATMEERAMQREAILRVAQQITDSLLSGEKADAFMADIARQVQNDANREKGFLAEWSFSPEQDRYIENYSVNPFQGDNVVVQSSQGVGTFHIPNRFIFAAERIGISREDFLETWTNIGKSGGDDEATRRFTELFSQIVDYLQSHHNTMEDAENFEREFNKWRSDNSNAFLENAELIRKEMEAFKGMFDSMIQEQRFEPLSHWLATAFDITERLSEQVY
jgi:hypothetical protein